jgi:hypothetical protein
MKRVRVLTTVHFANPGACLFTQALEQNLAGSLPEADIRTLDYVPRNWLYYEKIRGYKPHRQIPLFNLQRHQVAENFYRESTHLEKPTPIMPFGYENMVDFLIKQGYDALVVGMVIWDITDQRQIPKFPNIYWLSERIPAVKIAYAASGHRTQIELYRQHQPHIQRILSSYALIGVRDQITWEMVQEAKLSRDVPVVRSPDPTILYQVPKTNVRDLLERHSIDPERPILGMLFYGKPEFSEKVSRFYKQRGFQTVAFSMYNPYADVNIGHLITPEEWADFFNYLSFCVTDRFHGSIFCLKANIPFLSIEPYAPRTRQNSKVFSILYDFDRTDCYLDVYSPDFSIDAALEQIEDLRARWPHVIGPQVATKMKQIQAIGRDFHRAIQQLLD